MDNASTHSRQDQQWWFAQAGEYVLGTLADDEHQVFHKILEHDFDAQMYVSAWLQHLQPVAASAPQVNPPPEIWQELHSELKLNSSNISGSGGHTMMNDSVVSNLDSAIESTRETGDLLSGVAKSLFRARQWATVATVAAGLFAVLFGFSLLDKSPAASSDEFDGVAVLSDKNDEKTWVVDTASATNKLRVTSMSPPALPENKTYQLWAVKADGSGVESLALLNDKPNSWSVTDVDGSLAGTGSLVE